MPPAKRPRKTPSRNREPSVPPVHAMMVLLEDMRSAIKAVVEGQQAFSDRVDRQFGEFRSEVNQRFESVESIVRQNSADVRDIKTDVAVLKTDVGELKAGQKRIEKRLDVVETDVAVLKTGQRSIENHLAVVEHLDERVTTLEARRLA